MKLDINFQTIVVILVFLTIKLLVSAVAKLRIHPKIMRMKVTERDFWLIYKITLIKFDLMFCVVRLVLAIR